METPFSSEEKNHSDKNQNGNFLTTHGNKIIDYVFILIVLAVILIVSPFFEFETIFKLSALISAIIILVKVVMRYSK
jgi:hypothetical protein